MKLIKWLSLIFIFVVPSAFAEVHIYEANDSKLYVYVHEPSALTIDASWIYGNKAGHYVSSTISRPGKVLYTARLPTGGEALAGVDNMLDYLEAGTYVFRIRAQAHGGRAYIKSPHIRVIVRSL